MADQSYPSEVIRPLAFKRAPVRNDDRLSRAGVADLAQRRADRSLANGQRASIEHLEFLLCQARAGRIFGFAYSADALDKVGDRCWIGDSIGTAKEERKTAAIALMRTALDLDSGEMGLKLLNAAHSQ